MKRGLSQVDELKASMTFNVIGVLCTRNVVVDVCEECLEEMGNGHQRSMSAFSCSQCKTRETSVTYPMQVHTAQERSN